MSSILDALKKIEDGDNDEHKDEKPGRGVELNQEIDADAAERQIVAADSDVKKISVRLTPMVMLIILIAVVIGVGGIVGVTYFITRSGPELVHVVARAPQPPPPAAEPTSPAEQPEPAVARPASGQPQRIAEEPVPAGAEQESPAPAGEPTPAAEPMAEQPTPTREQPELVAEEPVPAVAEQEAPAPAGEPTPAAEPMAEEPGEGDENVVTEELRPPGRQPQPSASPASPQQAAVAPPANLPPQTTAVQPPGPAGVPLPGDPPPDLGSVNLPVQVPELKINVIRAKSPANPTPIAVVNMTTVREGNLLGETGVRVLKINDNDIWFEYKGYRFKKLFMVE